MDSIIDLPVRRASKLILFNPDRDVILVAGKSGRLNLPGGGIDVGENPQDALFRELYEEMGLEKSQLEKTVEVSCIQGLVTSGGAERTKSLARWTVFTAQLNTARELAPGDDIERIVKMAPDRVMGYNGHISALAKQALCDVLQLDR